MRRLAPLALAVLFATSPAMAAHVFPVNGGAVLNALPGEKNKITFKRTRGAGVFTDKGGNPLATDHPCESLAFSRSRCPLPGPNTVGISLGDRDDSFRVLRGSRLPRGSIVEGGKGDDTLRGGPGREKLKGGRGDDVIYAGRGRDTVFCGSGRDKAVAERRDKVKGCEILRRP